MANRVPLLDDVRGGDPSNRGLTALNSRDDQAANDGD